MKRVLVIGLFIILTVTGCGDTRSDSKNAQATSQEKSILVQTTQAEDRQSKGDSDNRSKQINENDIVKYLKMKKSELVNLLGSYQEGTLAIEQSHMVFNVCTFDNGLTFYGLTNNDSTPTQIDCGDNVVIKGVTNKMDFSQIQGVLGKTQVIDTWIANEDVKAYKLEYSFGDINLEFISYNKDGKGLIMSVQPQSGDASFDKVVITDLMAWEHPVKNVLKEYNIKVLKVELLKNKTYPIFYVEIPSIYQVNSQFAKYFDTVVRKIALANSYWDFEIIDIKNNIFISVEGDVQHANVKEIVVNGKRGLLQEMINYNMKMTDNRDKAMEYLDKTVPEIKNYREQINRVSNGKTTLTMRLDGVPDEYSNNKDKDYYCIYVGENHVDHTVRWNSFYVHKDFNKILVQDMVTGDLLTLEQWRGKNASGINSTSTSVSTNTSSSTQDIQGTGMNLTQIQAGDYSSLMGTWKRVACAINAQDGNGNQWRYENGSKNSNKSDITVTNNALTFFDGSCAFEGNTFTENIGEDNVMAHQLEFSIDNGSLIAEITDSDQVAINWWFSFYPKGITNDYGTNNGVKIDNTKNVIIVYCTNNTRASAFEQE